MNKPTEARLRANRNSDERQGRRHVTINMDADTFARWQRHKAECNDSSLEAIKLLLDHLQ